MNLQGLAAGPCLCSGTILAHAYGTSLPDDHDDRVIRLEDFYHAWESAGLLACIQRF